MESLIILTCTLSFLQLIYKVTVHMVFDSLSTLYSSQFCFLHPVFWVYSAHYLILLIFTFAWCKAGVKSKLPKKMVDVLNNRRLHLETVGEEQGDDAAGNNQSSISFHHALNQAVVRGTHKPSKAASSWWWLKLMPFRIWGPPQHLQRWAWLPTAAFSKNTLYCVFSQKKSRLSIWKVLNKATAACVMPWN